MDYLILVVSCLALASAVAFLVARRHHRRERFESSAPSKAVGGGSIFDLAEFATLPTGFRDLLRAQLSTLVGGLTVKLSDLYTANPEYVKTTLETFTQSGLASILEYSVPKPTATGPAPAPAPAPSAGPAVEPFVSA